MSWAPDESPLQIANEIAWLQGCVAAGVIYGVVVVLFAMCSYDLWARIRTKHTRTKRDTLLFLYVLTMFSITTTAFATNSQFIQLAFVNNRNYPGGPGAYVYAMYSIPVNTISNGMSLLSNWGASWLMFWRCVIIYKSSSIIVRTLVYGSLGLTITCSMTLGMFWLIQVCSPSSSPFQNTAMPINFTTPSCVVALAFDILPTVLIVARLLWHRRRIARALDWPGTGFFGSGGGIIGQSVHVFGGGANGAHYISIAAIFIESAAVYTVFSLLFIVSFATGSVVQNAFLQVQSHADTLASLLIIYRVLQGKAWSQETAAQATASVAAVAKTKCNTDIPLQTQTRSSCSRVSSLCFKPGPEEVEVTVDMDTSQRESV
ncbi:hypothetical protein BV22DRAFT_371986 [Leucogyrophana mollusca]|uniref:Uncharacterized protein n=1 Tax=Leucogyrophana mollusca TaxID=85980 RepID=A0ACB8BL44_9AGAM|nr:hypothetical protein BV22DRAFT_371986 [Leucogyrophana mollusca]